MRKALLVAIAAVAILSAIRLISPLAAIDVAGSLNCGERSVKYDPGASSVRSARTITNYRRSWDGRCYMVVTRTERSGITQTTYRMRRDGSHDPTPIEVTT